MSHPSVRRRRQPNDRLGNLWARLVLIIPGVIGLVLGWSAYTQGIDWYSGRSSGTNAVFHKPAIDFLVFGILLVVTGIFPWNWPFRRLKR